MTAFGALQGFLWTVVGLSLFDDATETRDDSLSISKLLVVVPAIIGVTVVILTADGMYSARLAIQTHVKQWDQPLRFQEQTHDFAYLGPDIIGTRTSMLESIFGQVPGKDGYF